jgi:DNA-binding SARP family transcriptional activator/ABC-type oligopeptide transport system substrate-binding subunit
VEFLTLGPLEVRDGDRILPLGGAKQRAALAILLLNRNRVVSRDRLVDGIWGDAPPTSAAHTLETYISRLRKALHRDGHPERLLTRPPGYLLRVDDGELDLQQLEARMDEGRRALAADDPRSASAALTDGLALFRGAPLEDLAYAPFAGVEIGRLDDLRAAALEQRIDADLALGRHADLIGELEALVATYPLREHAWSQLMLARYRSGRQGEALATFDRARHQLADELGIDPGESLQQLHQQILRQDPVLRLPQPTTTEAEPLKQATAETPIPARGRSPGRRRTLLLLAATGIAAVAAITAGLLSTRGSGRAGTVASLTTPNSVAVIDSRTGRFVADVDIHDSADALAYGYGAIWARTDGGVRRINVTTHEVTDIPVAPNYLAIGAGAAWVSVGGEPKIVRIDPTYGTRTLQLPTNDFPADWGGTDTPGGLVVADGSLWVAQGARFVRRINPATGKVDDTITVLGAEHLTADDNAVYVDGLGRVQKLDPARDTVAWKAPAVHSEITSIAAAGGFVWLTTSADDGVIKLSADTGQPVGTSIPISGGAERVAAGDGAVWVSNERAGTITRIDTSTDAKTTLATGHAPFGMAIHGDRVWVSLWPSPADELRAAGVTGATRVARISLPRDALDGNADPAAIWSLLGQQLEYATEAKLYNYPDRNGAAGAKVVPEVAAGMPTVSTDGRTVTIRVRSGYRFSPGAQPGANTPVTAETFRSTIQRSFSPGLSAAGYVLLPELVGGHAYATGNAHRLTGLSAKGDTLTLHLTRPVPDLPQILATPIFSVVPQGTPHTVVFYPSSPSAGPYYLTQPLAPIQWQMILKRNPNYHGPRPHHLDAIVDDLDLQTTAAAQEALRGRADVVFDPADQVLSPTGDLARRYRSARSGEPHYLQVPWRGMQYLALNTDHGPLRDASIRRAVNEALDRPALAAIDSGLPTDHYLPPGMPGVQDEHHVYPIAAPNLSEARALMHGRTPRLTLWTCTTASCTQRATILQNDLAAIGIKLQTRRFGDVRAAGNGYDIRDGGWYVDEYDPHNMLGVAMFGQPGYVDPPTTFTNPAWHHRVEQAATLDSQHGRFAAFGTLELQLMRDAAPWAAYAQTAEDVLLSARIRAGCAVENPVYGLDLAALCL